MRSSTEPCNPTEACVWRNMSVIAYLDIVFDDCACIDNDTFPKSCFAIDRRGRHNNGSPTQRRR